MMGIKAIRSHPLPWPAGLGGTDRWAGLECSAQKALRVVRGMLWALRQALCPLWASCSPHYVDGPRRKAVAFVGGAR